VSKQGSVGAIPRCTNKFTSPSRALTRSSANFSVARAWLTLRVAKYQSSPSVGSCELVSPPPPATHKDAHESPSACDLSPPGPRRSLPLQPGPVARGPDCQEPRIDAANSHGSTPYTNSFSANRIRALMSADGFRARVAQDDRPRRRIGAAGQDRRLLGRQKCARRIRRLRQTLRSERELRRPWVLTVPAHRLGHRHSRHGDSRTP
jgi:hypothetical protein